MTAEERWKQAMVKKRLQFIRALRRFEGGETAVLERHGTDTAAIEAIHRAYLAGRRDERDGAPVPPAPRTQREITADMDALLGKGVS